MEASPDIPNNGLRPTPRAVRRSHYGYKKISDALTYEANSQIALCSMRPQAVFSSFPHHVKHWRISSMVPFVAGTRNDHMGAVLSHRKGGGGTCNHLVKVKMKQLSVQDALNNKPINEMAALYCGIFVQSEKSNMSLSDSCRKR